MPHIPPAQECMHPIASKYCQNTDPEHSCLGHDTAVRHALLPHQELGHEIAYLLTFISCHFMSTRSLEEHLVRLTHQEHVKCTKTKKSGPVAVSLKERSSGKSSRNLTKGSQGAVGELSGSCQGAVKELSGSCQGAVRELSGSCQRGIMRLYRCVGIRDQRRQYRRVGVCNHRTWRIPQKS